MKNNLDETPTGPLKRVLSKLMQVTSIKRKKRKRKPISQGCSLGSEQLGGTVNVFRNPQTSGQDAKTRTVAGDRQGAGDTASERA